MRLGRRWRSRYHKKGLPDPSGPGMLPSEETRTLYPGLSGPWSGGSAVVDPWVPQPSHVVGTDEPLRSDLPCRACGYNLRGLVTSGRCPECGTAIGFSLHGEPKRPSTTGTTGSTWDTNAKAERLLEHS